MGATLKNQGKLDEAIEALNKALSLSPDHAGTYNNMGNTLREKDMLDAALVSYAKALAIKPDYADAYSNT
jgi:tetratricopeptide (TPR) repeat protein